MRDVKKTLRDEKVIDQVFYEWPSGFYGTFYVRCAQPLISL